MRILFISSNFDSQTARWIELLQGTGWDLHNFDRENLIHPDLRNITVHTGWKKSDVPESVKIHYRYPFTRGRHWFEKHLPQLWNHIVPSASQLLTKTIKKVKPDLIHIHGSNPYGYWFLDACDAENISIPWLFSNKGNDIFFWGEYPEHNFRLNKLMSACPYYICNCPRDLHLAKKFGFQGEFLGYFQGSGGYKIQLMLPNRSENLSSQRKILAVKGLQDYRGRALISLEAITLCAHELKGYEIIFFQAHPEVRKAVKKTAEETGLNISIFERAAPSEFYKLLGRSRMVIGASLSDGIPNAMLEGMIMGAFPIQTNPGGATEYWIQDGYNGLLIPPENPIEIASAIKRALADDELVDSASETNLRLTQDRLEFSKVQRQMLTNYKKVASSLDKL